MISQRELPRCGVAHDDVQQVGAGFVLDVELATTGLQAALRVEGRPAPGASGQYRAEDVLAASTVGVASMRVGDVEVALSVVWSSCRRHRRSRRSRRARATRIRCIVRHEARAPLLGRPTPGLRCRRPHHEARR